MQNLASLRHLDGKKLFIYTCPIYPTMGRKKGFDERKIASIIVYLSKYSDGVWLRQIAQNIGLSPSTVAKYIEGVLKPLVEDTSLGHGPKPLLRVIRLKPAVLQELENGKDLQHILKLLKMINNYK